MAILFDKKTKHYYIDCKFKKSDGTYFHFVHRENQNDDYKYKSYVASVAPKIIEEAQNELNKTDLRLVRNIEELTLRYCKDNVDLSYNSKQAIKSVSRTYLIPFFDNDLKRLFNPNEMSLFRSDLYGQEKEIRTKNNCINKTVQLIKFARKIKLIDSNLRDDLIDCLKSFKDKQQPKDKTSTFVSVSELESGLTKIPNKDLQDIFRFLYFSGCRIGEFLGIQVKDISFKDGLAYVKIYKQKLGNGKLTATLKTKASYRTIVYCGENVKILQKYIGRNQLQREDFLVNLSRYYFFRHIHKYFPNTTIHAFGRKSINEEMRKVGTDTLTRITMLGQTSESVNEQVYLNKNETFKNGIEALKNISKN